MEWALLLLLLLAIVVLLFAGWQWLRARYDVRDPRDLVDLIRYRFGESRASRHDSERWYYSRRSLGSLLVALVLLLIVVVLLSRGSAWLRGPTDDHFVVRIAPFIVAGQDERQGRLLAEQLASALRTQINAEIDLQSIDVRVASHEAAVALAQEQRIDVLIWGEALQGFTANQPGLSPRLVWHPDEPFVPRTWPGFDLRFALPATYDLALQPLNGAVVLPLLIDSLYDFSHGNIDRTNAKAEALLRDYSGQLRSEILTMLLAINDWSIGVYGDAEQHARTTLASVDRPEHWNNLGIILNDSGQVALGEAAFRQSLALAPDFALAHANLARSLLDQQRPAEALASIIRATQLTSDPRLLTTLGDAQRANGQLEAARDTFATILRDDPDNTAAQVEAAVLSLTDVPTATGRLEWELERPPVRSEQQLAEVRQQVDGAIARIAAQRADYLQHGNAYGVAGRIVMQRLSEQHAARLQQQIYTHTYDWLLAQIEAGRIEAAQQRNALARLWDGLRGRRTLLEEARVQANMLRDYLPARQFDLWYQDGRAAYYGGNLEAAQRAWDEAQAIADGAPADTPQHTRPEAHYGRAQISLAAGNRAEARERLNTALARDGRFFPAHTQLAVLAEQDSLWPEAAAHYRWLAEQRPFDPVGPLGLARALQAQGNLAEAEAAVLPLANAGNADALILLGRLYRTAGRLDEAERALQRAFEVAPGRPDLHEERAAVALARNDLVTAEAALKQALRIDEGRTSAHITLGQLYAERLDQPEAAAEQLRAAARLEPDNANAQRWLGEALLQLGDPEAAASAFQRALDASPGDYVARHGLAQAFLAQDRLGQAAQEEQRALADSNGTFVPALIGMGNIAQRLGRFDEAQAHYTAALAQDASATGAHLGLGRVAFVQGDMASAANYYRQGLAVDPQNVRLLLALGDLLVQTGDTVGALDVYEQARQAAPNNASVHASLGRALWQAGQGDAALAQLDRALRIDPNDADTLLLIGDISESMGRLDAALEAYGRAARVRSDWYEPYYRRGTLLMRQQRTAEAINDLERSVRLNAEFPQGAYWLGRAYRAADRLSDAERMLRRAIELKPDYYEARFFLGQTLEALGRPDEARGVYESIVAQAPPNDPWHVEAQQALSR